MPTNPSFVRRHRLGSFGIVVVAALLLGSLGQVRAQTATTVNAGTLTSGDRKFVDAAAQGGMAEVEMGQMAQQRGAHAQVKTFGQRMVQDHSKANDELKQVASAKGVALPTTIGTDHQHHADRLGKLSGSEFDRAYMQHMLDDHKKDVSDFEKAAADAKDPEVKNFATHTLPTLRTHLQLAQSTYDAIK